MKNRILFILIIVLLSSFNQKVYADELCSPNGYSIFTLNGIFTNETGAKENRDRLQDRLSPIFNNEPLTVDFLYNPSHLAGLGDLTDAINQGLFDQQSDYDLIEILSDASQKVKTQKLLLVAHSQGNFYSNSFYDQVASREGGVPSQSIGVYGVASPADRVAGGGKYLTSDTDNVIVSTVNRFISILPPNIHIPIKKNDGNGHSFSDVYLKYQGSRIVSDIKSSLSKLENNDEQLPQYPCIAPPELSLEYKITKGIFIVADPFAIVTKNVAVGTVKTSYHFASLIGNGVQGAVKSVASTIGNLGADNQASAVLTTEQDESIPEPVVNELALSLESQPVFQPSVAPPILDLPKNNIQTPEIEILINEIPEDIVTPPVSPTPIILYGSMVPIEPPVSNNPIPVEEVVEDVPEIEEIEEVEEVEEVEEIDETPPTITILGNNPEIITKNSIYNDAGATALDDVDGEVVVETTNTVNVSTSGSYTVTYTATDTNGNTNTSIRTVKVSSYVYIPKYKFGTENGDGNNWQAWHFNASYIYNWSDTYVNDYLRQQFNIQNFGASWCSNCLQRGIFNHDPQQGFEITDIVSLSLLSDTSNPQNYSVDSIFYVDTQWDSTGYSYLILKGNTTFDSGHVDVPGVGENMWIGWDGTFNDFQTFPSGSWMGVLFSSVGDLTGGSNMVLQPYPVYDPFYVSPTDTTSPAISSLSVFPNSGYVKIGDTVTLTIIADSFGYTAQSININNVAATDFTDNNDGTYTAIYTVTSGDSDAISGNISASVVLTDAAGNLNNAYTIVEANTLKIDANVPTVFSAEIILENMVKITFSEDLNGTTVTKADFTIAGHTILSDSEMGGVVTLTVNEPFTIGENPEMSYNTNISNGVKDLAGNVAPEVILTLTNNL